MKARQLRKHRSKLQNAKRDRRIQTQCATHFDGLNSWDSEGGSPPPRGTTGPFHLAILYPNRSALAEALKRLVDAEIPLDGAGDHGVSEALYLRDPNGNGVELYWEREEVEWPLSGNGELAMDTRPLDLGDLLREAAQQVASLTPACHTLRRPASR